MDYGGEEHQETTPIIPFRAGKIITGGVINVGSFDREVIILETERGVLTIKETNYMKQLNLEQGKLSLTGRVDSLVYSEESLAQNRGFFERYLSNHLLYKFK